MPSIYTKDRLNERLLSWIYRNDVLDDFLGGIASAIDRLHYRVCDHYVAEDCLVGNANWGVACTHGRYTACDEFVQRAVSLERLKQHIFRATSFGIGLDRLAEDVGLEREIGEPDWALRIRIFNSVVAHELRGSPMGIREELAQSSEIGPAIAVAGQGGWGFTLGIDGKCSLGINAILGGMHDAKGWCWREELCDRYDAAGPDCIIDHANWGVTCTDGTLTSCDGWANAQEDRYDELVSKVVPIAIWFGREFGDHYLQDADKTGIASAGLDKTTIPGAIIIKESGEGVEQSYESNTLHLGLDFDDWIWFVDWVVLIREGSDVKFVLETSEAPDNGGPYFGGWQERRRAQEYCYLGSEYRYVVYRFRVTASHREDFIFRMFTVKGVPADEAWKFGLVPNVPLLRKRQNLLVA